MLDLGGGHDREDTLKLQPRRPILVEMNLDGPYAGVDPGIARRMGGVIWLVGTVLAMAVIPLTPPTAAVGELGWALLAANGLVALAAAALLLRRERISFDAMLAGAYVALAQIGVIQWLAGGLHAPYWELLILPVLHVAAIHPPRRIAAFVCAVILVAGAPLVYEGWEASSAAALALGALLWIGSGVITFRLMGEVRVQRTESRRQEKHANRLARMDTLTGVGNRLAFDEALGAAIAAARETGAPLSVLLADIDSFKQINDEHGHVVGDSCLRQVAQTIQASVRASDGCFRWGGDEFAVLLPEGDSDRATELCDRIQIAVHSSCRGPDGDPLSVSCGHTELRDGMGTEDLLEAADLAMLSLKRSLAR
jgi:diguanylate cyclase (GGDEF)-like protein